MRTTIPLAALGYPEGIALRGGAVTLRLPVQPGLQRIAIRFPIDATGELSHAQVQLRIDGREVATQNGAHLHGGTLQADVAVPAGAHAIDITLLTRLTQCGAAPPPRVRVKESGTVTVAQAATQAQTPRESYGGGYTVVEPAHPDAAWQERALVAAYSVHVVDGWRRVSVALGATPAPGTIAVKDPGAFVPPAQAPPSGARTFSELGVVPLEQFGEDVDFDVPFTLGQLGGAPNRLIATLQVRAAAPGRLDALLNGREINTFNVTTGTQVLRVPMAIASLRGANALRLEMHFNHPQTFCGAKPPEIALDGSDLRWTGHGDIPMTLERRIAELSGNVVVESDPAIFPQAFVAMNTLGSVNRTISGIDARPLDPNAVSAGEIEIGAAPDVAATDNGSYGEVRVEPDGTLRIAYIGNPIVLNRLADFRGVLAGSDATRFEFGTSGAVITQGGPFQTRAQQRQQMRRWLFVVFLIVLLAATWLIAHRARRFS